jgi:hypothetical protein
MPVFFRERDSHSFANAPGSTVSARTSELRRVFASNGLNVAALDANIGKVAIIEGVKLAKDLTIGVPAMEKFGHVHNRLLYWDGPCRVSAGASRRSFLELRGVVAGNARNVDARDAEVGQGTIVQRVQFANGLLVSIPATKDCTDTHLLAPWF